MAKQRDPREEKRLRTKEIALDINGGDSSELPESDKLVFLPFSLANEWYAVEVNYLREVVKKIPITIVPETPGFLAGVINLRGEIITVYDLLDYLGSGSTKGSFTRILIINCEKNIFGLLTDTSKEVTRIPKTKIQTPLSVINGIKRESVSGIFDYQDKMISLLDMVKISHSPRLNSARWDRSTGI